MIRKNLHRTTVRRLLLYMAWLGVLPLVAHAQVSLEIAPGHTVTGGTATIEISGDWHNLGAFVPEGGIVVFTGAGDQQITHAAEEAFYGLRLDKPEGRLILNVPITILDRLSLPGGDLDLNGHVVTLAEDAVLLETPGHTVTGTDGYLTTTRTLDAPSGEDIAGLGVALTSAVNLGPTVIRRSHAVHAVDPNGSIARTFDLAPTNNAGLDATLVFFYDESELRGLEEEGLALFRSPDEGASWSREGGTANPAQNAITLSGIDALSLWTAGGAARAMVTRTLNLLAGWNIVGLPLDVADSHYQTLFPQAIPGTLFTFEGSYVPAQNLEEGTGYWLRFPDVEAVTLEGFEVTGLTLDLRTGWNMVAGPSCSVAATDFTDPEAIVIAGTLFGFTGSYVPAATLEPGQGYWVRTRAAGQVSLACVAAPGKTHAPVLASLEGFHSLELEDAWGARQRLYFGGALPEATDMRTYSLPPVVPGGDGFDARFSDERYVTETTSPEVLLQAPPGPVTVRLDAEADASLYTLEELADGRRIAAHMMAAGQTVTLQGTGTWKLRLRAQVDAGLPADFALEPNYPNPFNPETTIRFALPEAQKVSLRVYNVLGQEVAMLADETLQAGWHQVAFEASHLASGVYLYRIEAGPFTAVRQMLLVK